MGNLTTNFDRSEFGCPCGRADCNALDIQPRLVEGLQVIRDHFQRPVTINSGSRCWHHHKGIYRKLKQKVAQYSPHLYGIAADIVVRGVDPGEVADFAETIEVFRRGGIGRYETFTHLDVRVNGPARWGKAKAQKK